MPIHRLLLVLLFISFNALASPQTIINLEKDRINKNKEFSSYSHYDFLAQLNFSLKQSLQKADFEGFKNVYTYQKNKQVTINIIHNPYKGYQGLINNTAQSGSRVNGLNLQNIMTLQVLDHYCTRDHFYSIEAKNLAKKIRVQYETVNGKRVAVHKISRELCH